MPNGYYASNVSLAKDGEQSTISELCQTNQYTENIFNYELSEQILRQWVNNYAESNNDDYNFTMHVVYVRHTYSIRVSFSIFNSKGAFFDDRFSLPNMVLRYDDNTINPTIERDAYVFENIPYNKTITIERTEDLMLGFSVGLGWLDVANKKPSYTNTDTSITIENLTFNEELIYSVQYTTYLINLEYELGQGRPSVYVNSEQKNILTIKFNFDLLFIKFIFSIRIPPSLILYHKMP